MPSNVREIRWDYSTDPAGRPLALVIFTDRRCEYYPHAALNRV